MKNKVPVTHPEGKLLEASHFDQDHMLYQQFHKEFVQCQILQSAVIFQDMLLPQSQTAINYTDFVNHFIQSLYDISNVINNSHGFLHQAHQQTCTSVCMFEFN